MLKNDEDCDYNIDYNRNELISRLIIKMNTHDVSKR